MRRPWWYYVPQALLVAVGLWLVYRLRLVLAPFVIAYLLAVLLDPAVARLERRGRSRGRAVAAIFAVLVGLFILLVAVIVPLAIAQLRQLAADAPRLVADSRQLIDRVQAHLGSLGMPGYLQESINQRASKAPMEILARIGAWAEGVISSLGFLIWIVIIPIATALLLNDLERIRARFLWLLPERHRDTAAMIASDASRVMINYLRGLATVSALFGLTIFIILVIFRIPYSLAFGILAGILSLVPYIGALSTIVAILVVGGFSRGWGIGLLAALAAVVANQIFDQVISPRVVGRSVELHPVVNMMAILIGAELFGIVGVLVAVPVAAVIRAAALRLSPWLRSAPPEDVA